MLHVTHVTHDKYLLLNILRARIAEDAVETLQRMRKAMKPTSWLFVSWGLARRNGSCDRLQLTSLSRSTSQAFFPDLL